jgi:hexokinase
LASGYSTKRKLTFAPNSPRNVYATIKEMAKQPLELIQTTDYQQIKQNFLKELVLASEGNPSSISFIKNYLPKKSLIAQGIIQGIVIGGTNYILSTEEIKHDGTRKILDRKTGVLPIIKDDQTFFSFLDEHLDYRSQAVGINFGFPLETKVGSHGQLDGKLLYADKEHAMKGLIGKTIGKEVEMLFQKKFDRAIPVTVANDTICLTLSGDGTEQGSMIAGTGFNTGIRLSEDERVVVNLEAGHFNKFDQSAVLKKIDAESENPGVHVFEKTVSGKYLALYFNEKITELHLPISPITTSQELSELSHANHTDIAGDLARAIIECSAFLVAAAIAGLYEFSGNPLSFTIIGEGSLLWNGWHYHENIQKELTKLSVPSGAVKIKHIKDSSINGTIGLILS